MVRIYKKENKEEITDGSVIMMLQLMLIQIISLLMPGSNSTFNA